MDIKSVLAWIWNLDLIPHGYLTQGTGWGAMITAAACWLGHPVPLVPCPQNASQAFFTALLGLVAVGLGRRKS